MALVKASDKFGPIPRGPMAVRTTCHPLGRLLGLRAEPERATRILLRVPPESGTSTVELETGIETKLGQLEFNQTEYSTSKVHAVEITPTPVVERGLS